MQRVELIRINNYYYGDYVITENDSFVSQVLGENRLKTVFYFNVRNIICIA